MYKINKQNRIIVVMLVVLLAIFAMLTPIQTFCANTNTYQIAEDLNGTIVEELNQIDFSALNQVVEEFQTKKTNIFSLENVKNKVYSILSGENAISYENIFASLLSNLIELILKYLPLLSVIIAIGVVGNLLNGVKSKFNEKSTSNLINLVCFLSVVTLIIGIITNLSNSTGQSINNMVNQMNALFPVLLTLMVGIGANASAGAFQPIVAIMSTYIADAFNYFIMPLFMFSFVFSILNNFSDNIKLEKFSSFISSLFKWSVGLIFTLFFAVFTIQGITAGSFDSVSIRTTKFAIKTYI